MSPRITLLLLALLPAAAAQNQCLSLVNGTDGYVEIPASPTLVPASGLTFEAWITYDGSTLGPGFRWPTVVRKNIAAGQEAYFLRVDAGNTLSNVLRWKVVTATGGNLNASWTFAAGALLTWTHVAGTYDGAFARLYINGALVAQAAGTGAPLDNGGVLRIGKGDDAGTTTETWNGLIDEVRLWPFARSVAEIQASMNQELAALPGGVSTWNLNGNGSESSSGLNGGMPVGAAAFIPSTLALAPFPSSGASAFGAGSTTCASLVLATVTSLPTVGNAAFGFACTRTSPFAPGAVAVSGGGLGSPLMASGVLVWIDLTHPLFLLFPAAAGPLGATSVTIPLPPDPVLAFLQVYAQFAFLDPCGAAGLVTSDALQLTFLP